MVDEETLWTGDFRVDGIDLWAFAGAKRVGVGEDRTDYEGVVEEKSGGEGEDEEESFGGVGGWWKGRSLGWRRGGIRLFGGGAFAEAYIAVRIHVGIGMGRDGGRLWKSEHGRV